MKWKIKKNVIAKLFHKNINIIEPWGFETADSSAFFSLEEGIGYRYDVIDSQSSGCQNKFSGSQTVKMQEGKWKLNFNDEIIDQSNINRTVKIECLEDSYFMDFVMRFRIKKEFVKYAVINDKKIFHKNSNIYHQYPVDHLYLKGIDGIFNIIIKIKDSIIPDGLSPFMYVRDRGNEWIIHARMLPQVHDKTVIKLCNNWYKTKPIPQFLSKFLLLNSKIKNNLWYRGEFSPFKSKILRFINPAAFPMVKLKKGTKLMWDIDFQIIDKNIKNT